MKIILTALILLLLVSNAATSIWSVKLYEDREVLTIRSKKLESAIITMGTTFETEFPSRKELPVYPERDAEETTAELIEEPEHSEFWEEYNHELELYASNTLNIRPRYTELLCLYRWDPISEKAMRDPKSGRRVMTGPGTTQYILDEIVLSAEQQLERLGQTRDALTQTRKELVSSIKELNSRKQNLRLALNTVEKKDAAIGALNAGLIEKDTLLASREADIDELNNQVTDQNKDIALKEETIRERERVIKYYVDKDRNGGQGDPKNKWASLSTGEKGLITKIDEEWDIVLVDLTEEFIKRYAEVIINGAEKPKPEFNIMRKENEKDVFVGKIQLDDVNVKQKIGVANILENWQQKDFRKGDRVMF